MLDTHPIKYFCALRVRLFWVKMISGNHFHHFLHVWLSRKISFFGKWLLVDQYFHLWPGNQFLPSFSLQITSGERERERERKESLDQRERERRESPDRAARPMIAPRRRAMRLTRSRGAIDEIARRDWWDRAAQSTRSRSAIVDRNRRSRSSALVGRTPLVGAIEELVAFLLLGFGFFCLIWCIFCKNI